MIRILTIQVLLALLVTSFSNEVQPALCRTDASCLPVGMAQLHVAKTLRTASIARRTLCTARQSGGVANEVHPGLQNFAAMAETVFVIVPNGGEEWHVGDTDTIRFWASDPVDRIDSAQINLSRNGGATYDDSIGTVLNLNLDEPWNGSFVWQSVQGPTSESCKVKVKVWDRALPPNSAWDESDSLFSITSGAAQSAYYFRADTSGLYRPSGDTVRLFKFQPGNSADTAACSTYGATVDSFPLYYPYSTLTDSSAWVTGSFSQDTSISPGNWQFVLWATVDTVYELPNPLYHEMGVKVYRCRGGSRDSLLFQVFQLWPGLTPSWKPETLNFSTSTSVPLQSGDRLWVEVWTIRDTSGRADTVEVRFGYNGQPEANSHFLLPDFVGVSEDGGEEQTELTFGVETLRGGARLHASKVTRCSLFDVSGRLVRQSKPSNGIVEFRDLASGIYFILLENDNSRLHHKVLVLR